MTADRRQTGLRLASDTAGALERGEPERAVELADAAAAAFVAEQGEPNFDAPNMLRLRADALLTLGDHAAAAATLDRADAFVPELPAGEPFDRLRVHLGRLRGLALLDGGDRPAARAVLTATLERCEATLGPDDPDAAAVHNMLGIVGKFMGTFDDAAEHYARALQIYRQTGGGPGVIATLHHNLGGLAHSRGDLQTAERETRHALDLRVQTAGPAHRTRPATAASSQRSCRSSAAMTRPSASCGAPQRTSPRATGPTTAGSCTSSAGRTSRAPSTRPSAGHWTSRTPPPAG